jgi:hypothetical protein
MECGVVRLTLRTLLAYLDDTLEPAEAKAIGRKISESSTAQEIVARIREVVRRRRITALPVTGPGAKFDANAVAEYIDNQLPAEDLSHFEETCLESDVHLAEIAACHQILTVVLSEPSKVPPTARQRMYGVIQGPEAIPYRKPPVSAENTTSGDAEQDEKEDMLLLGLPFYRSQGGWFRRLAPVALALLGVLALIAIWIALPGGRHSTKPPADDRVAAVAPSAVPVQKSSPAAPAAPESAGQKKPDESQPRTPDKDVPAGGGGEQKAPDPVPPPPTESAPAEKPSAPPTPAPSTDAPKAGRKEIGRLVALPEGEPSILLERAGEGGPWQREGGNGVVHSGDELLSLPGYRSQLQIGPGVTLMLWGTLPGDGSPVPLFESGVTLHEAEGADADISLSRGRIRLANVKREGVARVQVRFHQEKWEVSLEPGAEVGIELSGLPDFDFGKDSGKSRPPQALLGLYVLKGQAELKIRFQNHLMREPPGPSLYYWSSVAGPASGPQPQSSLPAWASRSGRNPQSKTNQILDDLSKRMQGRTPVDEVLADLVNDPDLTAQRLGIHCLTATENLPLVLDELADEKSVDSRRAAIESLRHWLGYRPPGDTKLHTALEKKHRTGPAEIIMYLLHGFSPETRSKPATYEQLIEYIKSDKLPIRELAWMHLLLMPETQEIAKTIPFDPAGGVDQRMAAYTRWKELVPDGRMPPKSPPATGGGTKKPNDRPK